MVRFRIQRNTRHQRVCEHFYIHYNLNPYITAPELATVIMPLFIFKKKTIPQNEYIPPSFPQDTMVVFRFHSLHLLELKYDLGSLFTVQHYNSVGRIGDTYLPSSKSLENQFKQQKVYFLAVFSCFIPPAPVSSITKVVQKSPAYESLPSHAYFS